MLRKNWRNRCIGKIAAVILLIGVSSQLWAEISVGSTIRPLHLIAAEIVHGAGDSNAILPANHSPHHYSLQPDDRLKIARFDVLIWVGPELETYLQSLVTQLMSSKEIIQIGAHPALNLRRYPDGQIDPHVWLDTRNSIIIAQAIAESLIRLDSTNASTYRANLQQFQQRVAALEDDLAQSNLKSRVKSYAVYHNGYGYFEQQWGLNHDLAFTQDADHLPPMREMMALRESIARTTPSCLIVDVEASESLVATLMQGREFIQESLDIMGADVEEGIGAYVKLIRNLHSAFQRCAAPQA